MGAITRVSLSSVVHEFLARFIHVTAEMDLELAGQAGSGRKYYRIHGAGITWVLQQSHAGDLDFTRFVEYCELFSSLRLPTPHIYAVDRATYQVLLEDLGTQQLWDVCRSNDSSSTNPPDASNVANIYQRVLAELSHWQTASQEAFAASADLRSREFDTHALRWETEYFTEHYLQGYRGLSPEIIAPLYPLFDQLAERVAKHPRGLMHRDFQSQNVMVDGTGRIGFVDFQGARHGSLYYDAASLLWDPYVNIDPTLVRVWFRDWAKSNPNLPSQSFAEHWDCFLEASMQRLMQALGAYCNLSRNKGIASFAAHIGPGVERLRSVLQESSHPLCECSFCAPVLSLLETK